MEVAERAKQMPAPPPAELTVVTGEVVDAAFRVHSRLGPGLLESVYEACMLHELRKKGLRVERQVALPVVYDGLRIETGYRLDLLVEGKVVVELKSVEAITAVHRAQLRTYLKLSGHRVGLLLNFNEALVKHGITRIAV